MDIRSRRRWRRQHGVRGSRGRTKTGAAEHRVPSTTISGYVDVAAQYNAGNYGTAAGVPTGTLAGSKVDNFSLNNVGYCLGQAGGRMSVGCGISC